MKIDLYPRGILNDEGCRRAPGEQTPEPHICPYLQDMCGDTTTLCTCGPAQQDRCAEDI